MNDFKFSERSQRNLRGVNYDMRMIVHAALCESEYDFSVISGLRSIEEQKHLISIGASQTLKSKHLTGDAVDIAPWFEGAPRWEDSFFISLAATMRCCARELGTNIVWGGCWEPITFNPVIPCTLLANYRLRCHRAGKTPFADLGHFELTKAKV